MRDRTNGGVKFNSARVPAPLPWLYLKGISSGDMREALTVLLGDQAKGLSPNVSSCLKAE